MNEPATIPETPAIPALTHDTWSNDLDAMEVAFVVAYTSGKTIRNAYRSAIAAGYAESVARVKSYGWVGKGSCTKPAVRDAIEFLFRDKYSRHRMSADEVIAAIEGLARSDIRQVVTFRAHKVDDVDESEADSRGLVTIREVVSNTVEVIDSDELDDEAAATIKGIKQDKDGNVTVLQHDKVAALALLARHHGLADDRVRHLGPRGGPIEVVKIQVDMSPDEAAAAWRATIDAEG